MEDWTITAQPIKKIEEKEAVVKRKNIVEVGAEVEEEEVEVAVMAEEVEVEDEIIEAGEAEVEADVVGVGGEEVEAEKDDDTVAVIAELEIEDVPEAEVENVIMLVEREDVVDLVLQEENIEGDILFQRVL